MIELDFMVPPQLTVGRGTFDAGHVVQVVVSASPTIFPDHDAYVSIKLVQERIVLAEEPRVLRTQIAIDNWLDKHGRSVGDRLDREAMRRRKVLGR